MATGPMSRVLLLGALPVALLLGARSSGAAQAPAVGPPCAVMGGLVEVALVDRRLSPLRYRGTGAGFEGGCALVTRRRWEVAGSVAMWSAGGLAPADVPRRSSAHAEAEAQTIGATVDRVVRGSRVDVRLGAWTALSRRILATGDNAYLIAALELNPRVSLAAQRGNASFAASVSLPVGAVLWHPWTTPMPTDAAGNEASFWPTGAPTMQGPSRYAGLDVSVRVTRQVRGVRPFVALRVARRRDREAPTIQFGDRAVAVGVSGGAWR